MPKFSACGGHITIEIRLVMLLKCNFFAPAAAHHSGLICFMLVYRAPLHKHQTIIFVRACGRPKYMVSSFLLVYRAPLDKHKTLHFGPLQARKDKDF